MSLAVLTWQLIILATIALSGRKRTWIVAFWIIWTSVQIYALWLSFLQFFTIYIGYVIAKSISGNKANIATKKIVEEKQKAPRKDIDRLKVGRKVSHTNLGNGLIKEFKGEGNDRRINIVFEKHGSKWFFIAYTNSLDII